MEWSGVEWNGVDLDLDLALLSPKRLSCPVQGAEGIAAGHGSPLLESWERSRVNPEPNAPTQAPPHRWGLSNPGGTPP